MRKIKGFLMVPDFPKRVVHGGLGKREQEKTQKKVLDFSASVNPFPPQVTWDCDFDHLGRYPDNEYLNLKEEIARTFHRSAEEICVGNGSIEILRVFCTVTLQKNRKYFFEPPTFGEYELSARLAGATPAPGPQQADVFFICNPNNPTGELRKKDELEKKVSMMASHRGILFCDEAFIDLSDPYESLSNLRDPAVFVLQSLTKSFAVPGLRFGYGFGDPDLIEKIETARPPWSVNAFAEEFALRAFSHMKDLENSRFLIAKERQWLFDQVSHLGLHPHQSSVNYLLIDCGFTASPLCEKLGGLGILVRDCMSFGLPRCIRIAVRTRSENQAFVEALAACLP
jgi:threonine-phosphate decarboxylase